MNRPFPSTVGAVSNRTDLEYITQVATNKFCLFEEPFSAPFFTPAG